MAYDRYDNRREHGWRGSDHGDRGGRDDRGFFERAGDEISSWFGSDEDDRHRGRDERMGRGMNRGGGWSREEHGWGGDPQQDRDRYAYRGSSRGGSGRWSGDDNRGEGRQDHERGSSRPMNWTSSNRDYRSGSSNFGSGGRDYAGYGAGSAGGYGSGGFGGDFDRGERSYRPMAGDYSRSSGGYDRSQSPWGRDDYRNTSYAGSSRDNDRHYHSWRQQQLDELDRDYDHYCRERQDRFESDFGSWRNQRMQKRQQLGGIREHMDVVGSDGESIGKVDKVAGDRIILTKSDADDNRHHWIDCSMIETIEGEQVRLSMPAEEAKSRWHDVESGSGDRGMFGTHRSGRDDREEDVSLERSFSGTYR